MIFQPNLHDKLLTCNKNFMQFSFYTKNGFTLFRCIFLKKKSCQGYQREGINKCVKKNLVGHIIKKNVNNGTKTST